MKTNATSRRKLQKPARQVARVTKRRILVVGRPERTSVVRHALRKIDATIDEAGGIAGITAGLQDDTIAVVVASSLPRHPIRRLLSRIRGQAPDNEVVILVLVGNGVSGTEARTLYGDGATAVFEWPKEGLVFSRMVVELLAVDLVRDTMTAPDAALARTIRAHLKLVQEYRRVRVRVHDGIALVSGSVTHLWQKERLQELVSHVLGVRSVVVRHLAVEPSRRTDAQIRRSILRLLRDNCGPDDMTLAVTVEQGHVTLAGTVAARRELNRTRWLLANVKGVRDIDHLAVESPSQKQRDRAAARRLRSMLAAHFPEHAVDATLFAGVAVLSGTVERLRTRADIQATIEEDIAVRRVVNKIEIRSASAHSRLPTGTIAPPSP